METNEHPTPMTMEEYEKRKKELTDRFNDDLQKLQHLYCQTNALPAGTIVKDHIGYAKIQSWQVYHGYNGLDIIYRCENLTQKKETNKKEPERVSFHSNILKQQKRERKD